MQLAIKDAKWQVKLNGDRFIKSLNWRQDSATS